MRTLFAAALVLLAACSPATGTSTNTAMTLDGTSWKLIDVGGRPPVAGEDVTLRFAGGTAQGFASCNNYRAPYTAGGTTLSLGDAAVTRRACVEDARNAQETAYLGAFAKVESYTVTGDRLVLRDAAGTPLLTFTRMGI